MALEQWAELPSMAIRRAGSDRTERQVGHVILRVKLAQPPLRRGHIGRPRLVGRLCEGTGGRLTLLAAPLGFGKTTPRIEAQEI